MLWEISLYVSPMRATSNACVRFQFAVCPRLMLKKRLMARDYLLCNDSSKAVANKDQWSAQLLRNPVRRTETTRFPDRSLTFISCRWSRRPDSREMAKSLMPREDEVKPRSALYPNIMLRQALSLLGSRSLGQNAPSFVIQVLTRSPLRP